MTNPVAKWAAELDSAIVAALRSESDPPIVFVGSGIGREALPALPTSEQLARRACRQLDIPYRGEALSDVLQYLRNHLATRHGVVEWLKQQIRHGSSRPGGAHHLLLRLPFRQVLTTNYDTLIEDAATAEGKTLKVVTNGEAFVNASRRLKRNSDGAVLGYLHGSFRRNHHLIATTDDYIDSYAHSSARWRNLLRKIFRDRTVIFIGYSLRDFTTWTSYISTRLSTRHQERSRRVHLMVAPNTSPHFHEFWNRYGVKYVPLTAGQFLTAVHSELGTLRDFPTATAAVAAAYGITLRSSSRMLKNEYERSGWGWWDATNKLIGEAPDGSN